MSEQVMKVVIKVAEVVCFTVGPTLTVFNVFAFKVTRGGSYYYLDSNQWWIALGVFLISTGLVIKNWRKL